MSQIAARPRASLHGNTRWTALSTASGLALHAYRPDHVAGRIERALDREGPADVEGLTQLLRRDAAARARFRRAVAISVTGRLRDPHQFDLLRTRIVPGLLAAPGTLRVWSAGCSKGFELFDVAGVVDSLGGLARAQFLGSDLLDENVDAARRGGSDDEPVADAILARCRFEVRDLVTGATPDAAFGLILCRNVAIYFASPARDALMARLAACLAPGGVLMLGRSERLIAPADYGLEPHGPHAYRRTA